LRAQLTPSGRGKRPPADEASTAANSDHPSPDEKHRSTLSTAPKARLTPGILPSALRASLSAVPNRSRRFGQYRRERLHPLWRHAADRGQHRTTHREQSTAIGAILAHFEKHGAPQKAHYRPAPRAPPAEAA